MLGRWGVDWTLCACSDCAPCKGQRVFIKRSRKRWEKRSWQKELKGETS